ncbi:hypothetical protein ET495_00575 [Xylanimonas allomyrinae]|uniref:HTH luxR-type domain-containing protein n=1 Tax=Xylanimonas allomyrinae TaxID=2509459 RepID=A0A4P6EHZ1_9MICO|nr:hypothetical protein ET495_00575 [Xylanimonas allomyrinae]
MLGELRTMIEELLGGPVDSRTMARIATDSGGLPGLARTVALVGADAGLICPVNGSWTAPGALWSAQLAPVAESMLIDASPEDLEALALIAIASPLTVDNLNGLVPTDGVERLSALGLVDIIDGPGGGVVGVYPPLVGEYFAHESTRSRRVTVRERLLSAHLVLPPALAVDQHPPQAVVDTIRSHTLAEHLSAVTHHWLATWEADRLPASAEQLLRAMMTSSSDIVDPAEVYDLTDAALGSENEFAELAAWYALHLAFSRHDIAKAHEVLRDAATRCPRSRGHLAAVGQHLELTLERVPADLTCAAAGELPLSAEAVSGITIDADLTLGRTTSARAALDTPAPHHPIFVGHRQFSSDLACVLGGQIAEGTAQALRSLEAGRHHRAPEAIQAHGYAVALGLALQGQLDEVKRVTSSILTMTSRSTLHAHYRSGVQGIAEARERWLGGRPPSAPRDADDGPHVNGPLPYMALDLDSEADDFGEAMWARADDAAARDYVVASAFYAVDAAEALPDPARMTCLLPRFAHVESPVVRALCELAQATATRDLGRLRQVAATMSDLGAWLYVARAGVAEALILRAAGERPAAALQASRTWTLVEETTGGIEGLFAPLVRAVDLSHRELEIACRVVAGVATSEVANELVLSVRTVEHHLFNVYRKIGIDSREQLRRAFATWLRGPARAMPGTSPGRWRRPARHRTRRAATLRRAWSRRARSRRVVQPRARQEEDAREEVDEHEDRDDRREGCQQRVGAGRADDDRRAHPAQRPGDQPRGDACDDEVAPRGPRSPDQPHDRRHDHGIEDDADGGTADPHRPHRRLAPAQGRLDDGAHRVGGDRRHRGGEHPHPEDGEPRELPQAGRHGVALRGWDVEHRPHRGP